MTWCRRILEEELEMESHLDLMRKNNVIYLAKEIMQKLRRPKVR